MRTRSLNDFVASGSPSRSGSSVVDASGSGEADVVAGAASFVVRCFFFRMPEGTLSSTFLRFTEDIVVVKSASKYG